MFKFVVLLTVFACALAAPKPRGLLPQLDGRIVGGESATIPSFPYLVSLQKSGHHSCGGSIYTASYIVTAAHCLQDITASVLKVRAGSSYWNSGGEIVPVAAFKIHEDFVLFTMMNDIALLRLEYPLFFTSNIQPISLAVTTPSDGTSAVIAGWGTIDASAESIPTQLRSVNLTIVSLAVCDADPYDIPKGEVQGPMFCTYTVDKDSCSGDSGGPLVSNGVQVGIVSWGYGCAWQDFPGVNSDVAALRPWVEENVLSVWEA